MDWEYVEMEACRFWGYTLGVWLKEHHEIKARVIAYYIEHGMREEYAAEKIEASRPGGKVDAGPVPGWASADYHQFSQRRPKEG